MVRTRGERGGAVATSAWNRRFFRRSSASSLRASPVSPSRSPASACLTYFPKLADMIAELRDAQGRRLQADKRTQRLGGHHAGAERVLEAVAMGEDLLSLAADQKCQELVGGGLVVGGLEHGCPRHVQHVSGVVRSEIGDRGMHLISALSRYQ